ncbi:SlyX family protein [Thaumasiovibrio subtropicus]|uniref:SlyX family protein n=1 Tax=Thaumasiovibrio subtropicus TaxID=1891207 RepID=UPI000B35C5D9|nr:SlyX family protein [Thaumasiovibrio subtropicus]
MKQQDTAQLRQRIDELEMKVAFQDDTIDALNNEIAAHQLALEKIQVQMQHLVERVKSASSSNLAKESEETPPPHY